MPKIRLQTNLIEIGKPKTTLRFLVKISLILLGFIIIPNITNAQCNEKLALVDGANFNSSDLSASVDDNIGGFLSPCLGNISNVNRLIDADPNNYATVSIIAGLSCDGMLSVSHANDFQAGTFAGFEVGAAGLADISVFPKITIRTYLNGSVQETYVAVDDVLGLDANLVTGNGHMILGFITSQDFDKISIEYKTLLGVLFNGNVYNAVIEEFCSGPALDCNQQTSWTNPDYPLVISSDNTGISGLLGGLTCLLCTVDGADNVLTADQSDFASLNLDVAVGAKASLSVMDVLDTYAAGTYAGFEISDGGLLNVDALSGVTINTYLDGILQETAASGDLLSVGSSLLGGSGKRVVGFSTALPFDEVQIEKTNLVGALSTTNIYRVILQNFCPATIECDTVYTVSNPYFPVIIDASDTGVGGLVSLGCSVDNAQNVINGDETDYATITLVAGLGNSGSVSVKNVLQEFPEISYAGFVIESGGGLLNLELFNSITICTYLDDNMQECSTGGKLLDLNVLNIIGGNAGIRNVGFQTSLPYDEVKITVGSLLSLLTTVNVYSMYVNTEEAYGAGLTCISPNRTSSIDDVINTAYEHPTIGDLSTNDLGFNQSIYMAEPMSSADGTVSLNTDGTYTFTPAAGFSGETSFSYQSCYTNSPLICDTATVHIEVLPPVTTAGQLPVANPDVIRIKENTSVFGNLLCNKFDLDETPITISNITIEGGILGLGTLGVPQLVEGINEDGEEISYAAAVVFYPSGSYSVVPVFGFVGTIEVEYEIMDEDGDTDVTSLIIEVIPNRINTIFAEDDLAVGDAGIPLLGNVMMNDFDPEGNDRIITGFGTNTDNDKEIDGVGNIGEPTILSGIDKNGAMVIGAGNFMIDALGNYTLEPLNGFTGNILVPYTVCDDTLYQDCAEATLSMSVLEIFRDFGDAPEIYPSVWHRAMNDLDGDNIMDGASDVWLGMETTFEAFALNIATADSDEDDGIVPEFNRLKSMPKTMVADTQYDVDVIVNSNAPDVVYYGLWIDYDEDGVYDQFYSGSQATSGARNPTVATIPITTPADLGNSGEILVNTRLRADDDPLTAGDFQGGKTNGEVEDYQSRVTLDLPVEMIYFIARDKDCTVKLEWATASEQNNDYFIIEYSTDGMEFEAIDKVRGQGNTSKETKYEYVHKNMSQGNSYYRLKQVDFDKRYEYSQMVSTDVECANLNIRIYPNPTNNRIMIELSDAISTNETLNVIVKDVYGETMISKSFENCQPGAVLKLSLKDYPPGMYFVKSSQGNIFAETYKIFKR